MPIRKFKTFKEAEETLWVMNPDEKYYKLLKEYFDFWKRLDFAKGEKRVRKFKTYEEFIDYLNSEK